MASNNIILAVPTANTSVDYSLPDSASAKLSFAPEDISGLNLDGKGGLIINFVEGGSVTISNFQSFIDNGNTLSLADGTQVDPKLLFNALGGENDNPFIAADAIRIGIPAENSVREVTLEPGKKYVLNFDLSETNGAEVQNGDMVIGFANGGKIIINDYEAVMAGEMPPELSIASKTCVVTGNELIANIQALATGPIAQTVIVDEEAEDAARRKSTIADADMNGADDIGPGDETELGYRAAKVEPAAGEEQQDMAEAARELAEIETAAGGTPGARNSGYGYGSRPGSDPFNTNPDIGPIDPTLLRYRAPVNEPNRVFIPEDTDGNPLAIGPNAQFLDETNLDNGPISKSGTININYGADGPGGVGPNNSFTSSGSKLNGSLTHNGDAVTVNVVGNNYVGTTANGDVVFKLVIDTLTGDYTFTQYLPLDHADGTDPNDTIVLTFGIIARDGDGDSVQTSVNISIADDAPSIEGDEKTVDETDLGPLVVTGNLAVDFGEDGEGSVATSGTFSSSGSQKDGVLSSDGHAITVTHTANGYEGVANRVVIFELILSSTGGYTYKQYGNLDHANPNDPNDIIKLTFGAKVTDYDGDTDVAPIVINVKDDAPRFVDCGCGHTPTPGNAVEIIDETYLKGGNIVETGTLNVDFGVDAPGTFAFKQNGFTANGSMKGGALTHNGVPVVVTIENGQYVGKAGNVTVFTMAINNAGEYTFTLLDNLDHADGTNPNDIISLKFDVLASDAEGDSVQGSITVNVKDDAPIANDDVNTYDTTTGVANGNVITGLNGGVGAADELSQDDGNKVVKVSFGNTEVDVPSTGTVSIDGTYGKLTIAADGTYSYQAFAAPSSSTVVEKKFAAGPALPDFEYQALDATEQQSKGIAAGNLDVKGGDTIQLNFVKENATNHNTVGIFTVDAQGNITVGKVLVKDTETAGMETQSFTVNGGAVKAGLFLISGFGTTDPILSNLDYTTGTLSIVYGYGTANERTAKTTDNASDIKIVYTAADGSETVIPRTTYFSSERGGSSTLNPDGKVHVVSGIPEGDDSVLRIGFEDRDDNDYNDAIFDIKINSCDKGCGCGSNTKDVFGYVLEDGDGDRDPATLTLTGKDLTDHQPIFTAPGVEIVDETNLASGILTETGNVTVNFGSDGPGSVDPAGTFSSSGSKLNGALTSNGVPVVVTLLGDVYTGKAGNTVVFTLEVNTDGSYEFKLYEQLDHADGTNDNDAIDLHFGLLATDCDGDTAKQTLTVRVLDDAPVANDDIVTLNEKATANGNVVTNDQVGQDIVGTVTQVVYKGVTYTVPASGNAVINADYGTLSINKEGVYTYVAKDVNADKKDVFTYTLRDNDGDVDTANLEINVKNLNDIPEIIKPADEVVDETNLSGGTITETGTVTADFKGDGPGTFAPVGANSFSSSGSKLNGALTHNGTPVVVTLNGDTYEGKAGALTVFTLKVNANGSYEFKLFDNLDHADGTNADDAINLVFGIKATDNDGDSVSTTLTVVVKDDAPTIQGSSGSVDETNLGENTPLVVNGDLTHNFGQDGKGTLVEGDASAFVAGGSLKGGALSSNGVPVVVTLENGQYVGKAGNVTVFTLDINENGTYKYTQFKNLDHANNNDPNDEITLQFDAKIIDFDGDSAKAPIVITVRDDAPSFPPENPDNPPEDPENPGDPDDPYDPNDPNDVAMGNGYRIVDETNLSGGNIVTQGTLNADFGADAPGSYAFKSNSFTSYGSKTGNALSSNGVPVVVTLQNGQYVGKAGNTTVFTLDLNTTTGAYKFTLLEQLDHANGNNPNDVINLVFGVEAKDSEGDSASGTIRIDVRDDAPDANDDTINVNENSTATGNVTGNDVVGQDVPGTVTQVVYKGVTYTVPANGDNAVIVGDYGTLSINKTGAYTYVAKSVTSDKQDDFVYTLRDHDGDKDTAKLSICVKNGDDTPEIIRPADEIVDETNLSAGVITETGTVTANFFGDGPGTFAPVGANSFSSSGSKLNGALTSNGAAVNVTVSGNTYTGTAGGVTIFTLVVNSNGSYEFKLYEHLDHADGNDPNDIINLNFGIKATDADGDTVSTTLTVKVQDDAPVANDDTVNVNENGTANGNVTNNDSAGQDTPATVTVVTFKGVNYTVPANGDNVVINGDHGTLSINKTGAYSYVAGSVVSDEKDVFVYTLKDHDGDIDTAKLEVCILNKDETPDIVKPDDKIVDETNLANGTITAAGKVVADYKGDGPGAVSGTGSFTSGGSRLGGTLSHKGTAIDVTYSNNTYTGKAGSLVIFTLAINADGTFTFRQFEQLDHANGSDPDDIINLNFGVKATDADGDSASTTVTVQVKDDAPVAKADYCTIYLHDSDSTISSNALANDNFGQDAPGSLKSIMFGNSSVNIPASGTATIYGNYGYLTIAANGEYTYTLTNKSAPVATENFAYRIADYDGDTSNAELHVNIVKYDTATKTSTGSESNDVMYGISGAETMYGNGGDDWLYGRGGNDTLYGGNGKDRIVGGSGDDTLYGGAGADTFLYETINDGVDRIKDFNKAEGDKLDLSALLTGFDPVTESINDFVFATQSGGNTTISVNVNGTGAGGATTIAVLEGVNVSITDLFNNGHIVH